MTDIQTARQNLNAARAAQETAQRIIDEQRQITQSQAFLRQNVGIRSTLERQQISSQLNRSQEELILRQKNIEEFERNIQAAEGEAARIAALQERQKVLQREANKSRLKQSEQFMEKVRQYKQDVAEYEKAIGNDVKNVEVQFNPSGSVGTLIEYNPQYLPPPKPTMPINPQSQNIVSAFTPPMGISGFEYSLGRQISSLQNQPETFQQQAQIFGLSIARQGVRTVEGIQNFPQTVSTLFTNAEARKQLIPTIKSSAAQYGETIRQQPAEALGIAAFEIGSLFAIDKTAKSVSKVIPKTFDSRIISTTVSKLDKTKTLVATESVLTQKRVPFLPRPVGKTIEYFIPPKKYFSQSVSVVEVGKPQTVVSFSARPLKTIRPFISSTAGTLRRAVRNPLLNVRATLRNSVPFGSKEYGILIRSGKTSTMKSLGSTAKLTKDNFKVTGQSTPSLTIARRYAVNKKESVFFGQTRQLRIKNNRLKATSKKNEFFGTSQPPQKDFQEILLTESYNTESLNALEKFKDSAPPQKPMSQLLQQKKAVAETTATAAAVQTATASTEKTTTEILQSTATAGLFTSQVDGSLQVTTQTTQNDRTTQSLYFGKGQYEKTSGGVLPSDIQRDAQPQIVSIAQASSNADLLRNRQSNQPKDRISTANTVDQTPSVKPFQPQTPFQVPRGLQIPMPRTPQQQAPQTFRRPTPRSPITLKIPQAPFFVLTNRSDSDQKTKFTTDEEKELYDVFIRRKGQDFKVGSQRTKSDAARVLFGKLKTTLAASGYVQIKGVPVSIREFSNREFVPIKNNKQPFRVVQKRQFRLSSFPERKEIQMFRKNRKKKRGLF